MAGPGGLCVNWRARTPIGSMKSSRDTAKFPETEIFAEYKPSPDWLLRAYVDNILDDRNIQKRFIYNGARGSSTYQQMEDRRLTYGPTLGLSAQYSLRQ